MLQQTTAAVVPFYLRFRNSFPIRKRRHAPMGKAKSMEKNIPIVVSNMEVRGNVVRTVMGENVGTTICA